MGAGHELEFGEHLTLLTAALAELPDATLLVFDRDLRFRLARGGALPGRGSSPGALEGQLVADVLGPEQWAIYESPYRAALAGRRAALEVHSPDGERVFNVNVAPLHDSVGGVIGGVAMAVDVTERAEAVAALARSQERLQSSEMHFRLMAENASDVVLEVVDGGLVSWVSPSVERLLGWTVDELIGTNANRVIALGDLEEVRRVVGGMDGSPSTADLRCRVLTATGSERWMAVRIRLIPPGASGTGSFVVALRDIGEELAALADRDEGAAELGLIVDTSPDAIVRLDTDLRVTFVNRAVRSAYADAHRWIGRRFPDTGLPDEAARLWDDELHEALATGELRAFEVQGLEEFGRPWWDVRVAPSTNVEGEVTHLTLILRDITTRKGAEQELFLAATHDPLTGLANRVEVLAEIERALSAARRSARSTAVLMLDLDHFKLVNDSLGHAVGDQLLLAAAQRLTALVRSGDMAGRLGGDEFVVVMRDLDDPTEAARIGERVVNAFRAPLPVGDLALVTTASAGLTVAGPLEPSAAELLREADTALYRAKGAGRDALEFFSEELRAEVTERLVIEDALRRALDRGELELWYQPEVALGTGRIDAVEALLRWRHPSGEVYAAERFIKIAEDAGLIVEIGDWVIHQACAEAARWAERRPDAPLTVRINLSAAQLSEVGLVDQLRSAIATTGTDPSRLCLEVTEAALLHDLPTAREKLQALRALGVTVAVDAFGVGDSSIRCLRECEIDIIKIDPILADDIDDRSLMAGVLAMARTLGLPVTAKGIETSRQAEVLRALGCKSAQGWLFSRAVEPRQIDTLIEAGPIG